jgi:hypothetical protein
VDGQCILWSWDGFNVCMNVNHCSTHMVCSWSISLPWTLFTVDEMDIIFQKEYKGFFLLQ